MTKTLPRKEQSEIEETVFLRPQRPDDHRQFEELLPWCTPLFVYANKGKNWVRWAVPKTIAEKLGLPTEGCVCCGEKTVVQDDGDYHVDTAWHETSWWLTANGYALPNPTKEGNS